MDAYFLDSSALVKRYSSEVGTTWLLGIYRAAANNFLGLVRIAGVEVISALTRKHVAGQLSLQQFERAEKRFRRDFSNRYFKADVSSPLIISAMDQAKKHGLRGYDAVQLAAAIEVGQRRSSLSLSPLILDSADNDLNFAAQAEGLTVENPNNHP